MRSFAGLVVLSVAVCGCAPRTDAPQSVAASPTPTPAPRLGAVATAPTFGWSDRNNNRVAQIRAESGAATGATGEDTLGELTKGTATLFQKNKPVATVTADRMRADQAKRTLTATGNVRLLTVAASGEVPGELRADRLEWRYDQSEIRGSGNVRLTRGAQMQIPGSQIVADTRLQTVEMTGDGATITGAIP